MGHDDFVIIGRVTGALVIGALIGFERTFHGRPAGFRTHSLVCIASAILMIVTVYQNQWMTFVEHDAIRTDPTRMAQGIMTGIGFLGAGVIFKEGLTVRGLTTAASIWVTAAIGILVQRRATALRRIWWSFHPAEWSTSNYLGRCLGRCCSSCRDIPCWTNGRFGDRSSWTMHAFVHSVEPKLG